MAVRRSRFSVWMAVLAALALVAGGVAWMRLRPPGGDGRRPPLDAAAARGVASRTNVALGLLENQALDDCIPLLEALRDAVPDDPLPRRNLAVARTVALGDGGAEPAPKAVAAAAAALADAERGEGASSDLLWLRARGAQAARDATAWRDASAALVAALPEDAAAWYERFRAGRAETPGGDGNGSREALEKALALDPRNLWLVIEWCRALALDLGKRPPPPLPDGLAAALEARWPAMEPFAPSIRTFANVDARDLLDKAIAAAAAGDAAGVAGRLRGLANVLVPQSEADRRAIERHPLEFVIERYRPEFYAAAGLGAAAAPAAVPVTFAPLGPGIPAAGAPPAAVLLEDFDLDGDAEAIVLSGTTLRVFEGVEGGAWRELAAAEVPAGMRGVVAADLDLDFDEARRPGPPVAPGTDPPGTDLVAARRAAGCPAADLDFVVHGDGGIVLLENVLDAAAGTRTLRFFAGETPAGPATAAAVADLDADGYLDLVAGSGAGLRLWRNLGKGGFVAWPGQAEVAVVGGVTALVALDWDRDVDVDVMVAGDGGAGWLENLLHGQFRFAALAGGSADALGPVAALDVVDGDADGAWDLLLAGPRGARDLPSRRGATGVVRTAAEPRAPFAAAAATGLLAFDYDNDGVLDAALVGPGGLALLRGAPDGTFAPAAAPATGPAVALDAADLDADGDLDLAVAGDAGVTILENRGGNANHWIDVALEAQQIKGSGVSASGRVNAHGLGSLLELKAGDRYQPRPVRRRTTHFGLGAGAEADVVRVAWINGVPQNVIGPPADTLVCEEQILLGSCPYLYVWDGERFVFATDLLWGAPLGLQRSEGVLMPARAREWLKIDAPLVPRDGRYELRVTEELWEAAYFDSLRLHVVDHPADVAIYSNEKVGPAEIAPFRIHTVRAPIAPHAARDGAGGDVLADVAAADGRFAPTIRGKRRQGLVTENVLELDFGPVADTASATLFLTGWIYPT
ncbi:MAG: CRTAC1 family protein, partial [Planctomycetaceae bacterium]